MFVRRGEQVDVTPGSLDDVLHHLIHLLISILSSQNDTAVNHNIKRLAASARNRQQKAIPQSLTIHPDTNSLFPAVKSTFGASFCCGSLCRSLLSSLQRTSFSRLPGAFLLCCHRALLNHPIEHPKRLVAFAPILPVISGYGRIGE